MQPTPTIPLRYLRNDQRGPVHPNEAAAVAAQNQKNAAPTHVIWKPVFHFAGPIALITTPRLAAMERNTVMATSRPRITIATQSGNPTEPHGVRNLSEPAVATWTMPASG